MNLTLPSVLQSLGMLLGLAFLLSCHDVDGQRTSSASGALSPVLVSVDECARMIGEGGQTPLQLLDVRTPNEWNSGHLADALHFDFMNRAEFNEAVKTLNKDQAVMVYCAVGGRSAAAANYLAEQGFTKVYDMEGGINAWRKAGKKLVK